MTLWTNNLTEPTVGVEGQLSGSPKEVRSGLATAAIRAGLLIQRTPRGQATGGGAAAGATVAQEDTVSPLAVLPAADADSILVGPALPVIAGQAYNDVAGAVGGVLDGVIGPRRIFPPRSVTATFDAHANWGLAALGGTWCFFNGDDANGEEQMEWFFLPAGGGVTVTSTLAYSRIHQIYIGACDGAGGGAATFGTSNAVVAMGKLDFGFACYDRATEPSATATVTFDANEMTGFLKDGDIWCINETTNALAIRAGDPIAARIVLAGADVRGQVSRHTSLAATPNFAHVLGAYSLSDAAAGEPVLVRFGG